MDPSIFFGRSRATRQTIKSKSDTPGKENVEKNEVNAEKTRGVRAASQRAKGRSTSTASEKIEAKADTLKNSGKKETTEVKKTCVSSKSSQKLKKDGGAQVFEDTEKEKNVRSTRNRKSVLTVSEQVSVKDTARNSRAKKPAATLKKSSDSDKASQKSKKQKSVHFINDERKSKGNGGEDVGKETENEEDAKSGPVYKNVSKSDAVSDPYDNYDFLSDENAAPAKKKRVRKKKPDTVKLDPSKRSVTQKAPKARPLKNPLLSVVSSLAFSDKGLLIRKPVLPVKKNPPAVVAGETHPSASINSCEASSPIPLLLGNHPTSTPVASSSPTSSTHAKAPQSGLSLNQDKVISSTPIQDSTKRKGRGLTPGIRNNLLNEKSTSHAKLPAGSNTQAVPSPPLRPGLERQTTKIVSQSSTKNTSIESCNKNQQKSNISLVSSPIPSICVRESPSFMEVPCEVDELPGNSELIATPRTSISLQSTPVTRSKTVASNTSLLTSSPPKSADTTQSTPITRSKSSVSKSPRKIPTVHFATTSPHDNQTKSPDLPSGGNQPSGEEGESDTASNLSALFDDLPRTSVLPTRMFSTHRGTIFIPADDRLSKKVLPKLSPSKTKLGPRSTIVKFSVPPGSSGVDDCFGFDDEDDYTFIPPPKTAHPKPPSGHCVNSKEKIPGKPNLTIPEVQALIRGQLKISSPMNNPPNTVQKKLTDYVCATPKLTKADDSSKLGVLTPTPVPLFGEEHLDPDLPSPFIRPSRRSYDRFKPVKRVACGDEVHSDDEVDDGISKNNITETAAPEFKKKNKSYRKKKKVDTELNKWATEIESHFHEIENVDLELG